MNNTICSAFWNHTNVRGGNRIFPCCRFKKPVDVFNGDLENILHSPAYNKLRSLSKSNTPINECQKCYLEEELGKKSLRQEFNETYNTENIELKFLEIGFDNICNLTCDGCWGEFSSSWANKENPTLLKKDNVLDTNEIQSIPNSIRKIIFLGGEPLMTNRHLKMLYKIENLSKISLIYYTNGTFLLSDNEIKILKQAESVQFILSIDGIGKLNETVRSGSNWDDILKFLDQMEKHKFTVSIHSVIHLNNWHGFIDLSNFIKEQKFSWTVGLLTYPVKLSIQHLNNSDKDLLRYILHNYDIPNRSFILEYIK